MGKWGPQVSSLIASGRQGQDGEVGTASEQFDRERQAGTRWGSGDRK